MSGSSSRRRISHAITIAIAALGLGLVAPTGTAVGTSSAAAECQDTPSHARVRAGTSGVDPNSVSAAQVRAMNRQLNTKADRLAARGIVSKSGVPRGHWHQRNVRIKTIVHVITAEDGTGGVTRQQVRDQVRVMNDGFRGVTSPDAAPTRFRFVLKKLHYVANDDWFDWEINADGSETEAGIEAKTALHRGGWRTLNVYIANLQVYLGYATFPQDGVRALDGLVVLNESLPGGTAAPYNEGDTATHEVGHWLGLFHTFQNGCNAPGDSVRDTPYQFDGENIFFCEESDDTCTQPGTDPVHNFMSYGDDPCLDQFTRGQHHRMLKTWFVYRAFR